MGDPRRRPLSTTKRGELFLAKGGLCHLCGGKMAAGEPWDVSHPIPLAIGGADDATNHDIARRKCHRDYTAAVDAPMIAKVERVRLKRIGAYRSPSPMSRRRKSKPPKRCGIELARLEGRL